MKFIQAETEEQIQQIRELFTEYAASLGFDLCFQDFDNELAKLPGDFALPDGRLLMAVGGTTAAGCVALKRIEDDICEMSRLYVRPEFRGKGVGRRLAAAVIEGARQSGFERIRLHTLATMKEASALYQLLGFQLIEPYCQIPQERCMFMELIL
ncbi:GNAT family N-acetyltransferase [bacterium]|nr:GNAT family N-acetyltransferase [bacterium]MBU1935759.1 GNAT family N-acetyltransferase [bacterium]